MERHVAYSDKDWPQGTQTLGRGLSIILAVKAGVDTLSELALEIGCTRSTTQRLTAALLQQGWLRLKSMGRYGLGEKLTSLTTQAQAVTPLLGLASPLLQNLNETTGRMVHLGVRADSAVIYLMRLEGRMPLSVRSRTGQHLPLARTGTGRALILDELETEWARLYRTSYRHMPAGLSSWINRMRFYRSTDCVFDLEDDEIGIHCVASPVRDASGSIVASISVTGGAGDMPLLRMKALAPQVRQTASLLSAKLGWHELSDVAD
ncbi:IclR family transcriptional regulator [Asaia sp. As-1742]|nr:IclR family transcriptional regulator [Asaia sp. As-1742]NIE80383.1 IclR family transcriptional regulator [Asaia sp. As-1742]